MAQQPPHVRLCQTLEAIILAPGTLIQSADHDGQSLRQSQGSHVEPAGDAEKH